MAFFFSFPNFVCYPYWNNSYFWPLNATKIVVHFYRMDRAEAMKLSNRSRILKKELKNRSIPFGLKQTIHAASILQISGYWQRFYTR